MHTIRPQGARFAAQMNAAAKLNAVLVWHDSERRWTTSDEAAARKMRSLGASVETIEADS
jgi:hypothetical protein